jgi:hypothetical protein
VATPAWASYSTGASKKFTNSTNLFMVIVSFDYKTAFVNTADVFNVTDAAANVIAQTTRTAGNVILSPMHHPIIPPGGIVNSTNTGVGFAVLVGTIEDLRGFV